MRLAVQNGRLFGERSLVRPARARKGAAMNDAAERRGEPIGVLEEALGLAEALGDGKTE